MSGVTFKIMRSKGSSFPILDNLHDLIRSLNKATNPVWNIPLFIKNTAFISQILHFPLCQSVNSPILQVLTTPMPQPLMVAVHRSLEQAHQIAPGHAPLHPSVVHCHLAERHSTNQHPALPTLTRKRWGLRWESTSLWWLTQRGRGTTLLHR